MAPLLGADLAQVTLGAPGDPKPLRCLPDVSQMPPRCLPDASRCLPDADNDDDLDDDDDDNDDRQ